MKRLCIYVTYDFENIVDDYIGYMLCELRKAVDCLVVVCNYEYIAKGIENVEPYADKIYHRENIGFDAGGFKETICSFIGWENVYGYDELILANDSMFGPFIPMKQIFSKMEKNGFDFWGITKHGMKKEKEDVIYEHIQSYFLVIGEKLLHSGEFKEYWNEMPYYTNFNEVVWKHEMLFTQNFCDLGYQYGCFADMTPNESENCMHNYTQYGFLQYELIKKRNFPFLKKKPITFDTLDLQTQENWKQAINYIDQNTDYDVDMIWENLIRTIDISDLQRNFHLEYIVSEKRASLYYGEHRAVIAVFSKHIRSKEYVLDYLDEVKEKYRVVIFSPSEDIVKEYQGKGYECFHIVNENMQKSMLMELAEYAYVCILHDYDMTSDTMFSCTRKSFFYNIWHNLLAGMAYIDNLIDKFESEKRLGVLLPPVPNFAEHFGEAVREWELHFDEVEKLVGEKQIHCRISKDKRPFSISECAWVRGEVFKEILRKDLILNKLCPFVWTYAAQSLGFYTGIVESNDYAALNEINQQNYLQQIVAQVNKQYGEINSFLDLQRQIFKGKLLEFCNKHNRIYVYGAGYKAKQYEKLIPDIEAYIVSDGQPRNKREDGKPVLFLSEIVEDEDLGIVVCLNEKNQEQVIPLLKRRKFSYICI